MSGAVSGQIERAGMGCKDLSNLPEEAKKALIVRALSAQGYRPTDAAALLNIQRSYVAKVSKRDAQGLLAPLARIARRSIKQLAKGELVGAMTEVRGSDVMTACKSIMDRAEPIVNKQEIRSTSLNVEITSEDMHRINELLGVGLVQNELPQPVVIPAIDAQFELCTPKEINGLEHNLT
jgi:hypothetical protein